MSKFVVLMLALLPIGAGAVSLATPATLTDVVDHLKAGEIIRLSPGTYSAIRVRDRHWKAAVTIDGTDATLVSVRLDGVSGLTWHGGKFKGAGLEDIGFNVSKSDHIIIDGASFNQYRNAGIALNQSSDAILTGNVIFDSGSDGIDIGLSQRVVIDHNRCTDFRPSPGAHPDCIQLWSKPNFLPVSDVTITNNVAIGDMQGFTAFDGPYNHIVIEHNFARVTAYHGIALFDCQHCAVRHNRVESMPNLKNPETRAWIAVLRGDDVDNCDNRATDFPNLPGRNRCKRGL